MPTTSSASNRLSRFWLASSVSLVAALQLAAADTAEDYFHHGATNYVFERLQQARQVVKAGLAKFPQDRLLIELDKLLNPPPQPQQSQDQQNQQQQQQDAGAQQNQAQDQTGKDRSPQPQQPETDAAQPQADKPQPDHGSAQPQAAQDQPGQRPDTQADQTDRDPAQAADLRPGQMTPEEARRLLDRHRNEERLLLFVPPPTNRVRRPMKDW